MRPPPIQPAEIGPEIRAVLGRATFRPVDFPAPLNGYNPVVVCLDGYRLGGWKIQAGAIFRVPAGSYVDQKEVEWWAVAGTGRSRKDAKWVTARVGVGVVPPWELPATGIRTPGGPRV